MNHNLLRTILIKINSILFTLLLRYVYQIKVGKNLTISGIPYLKIKGKSKNIIIMDNVTILGSIDIRNREQGKIVFRDNVTIEENCRFVSAQNATIIINKNSSIGRDAIWNCGASVEVGENCLFGPRSGVMSSDHGTMKSKKMINQEYTHKPIKIGDDCLIGINVTILKGVHVCDGSIIASNSVVTKDTKEFSINAGLPAKMIGSRE